MALSDSILSEFDQEMANTRKLIERCPDDKFDWSPHQKSLKLGSLVSHLANLPVWVLITINQDSFDTAPKEGEAPRHTEVASVRAALDTFEKNVVAARDAIAGADDARLLGKWTLLTGGEEKLSMPKVAVLRSFVMNHMIHHRGQLTVYLRLLDVPLPAIYGSSADDPGI